MISPIAPGQPGTIYRVTAQADRFVPVLPEEKTAQNARTLELVKKIFDKFNQSNGKHHACFVTQVETGDRLLITGTVGQELFLVREMLTPEGKASLDKQIADQARFTILA